MQAIWAAAPPSAQARSREGVKQVAWAVRDLAPEAGELAALVAGIEAFYAHPDRQRENGRFAPAPHRLIDDPDKRAEVLAVAAASTPQPPPKGETGENGEWLGDPRWEPTQYGGPAGHHPLCSYDDPGPQLQWGWLEDWYAKQAYERDMYWPEKRGPMPGQPGCRIWEGLHKRYRELNANRSLDE